MRPIPRRLLQHSAVLVTQQSEDVWQMAQETFVPLAHVCVEPGERWVTDAQNRKVQLSATLFFDCKVSVPHDVKFHAGEKIRWDGGTYTVETAELLYVGKNPHHWEVGLS